ncbi:TadE family type IV pilus minor pilin [Kutzneria sp. NPDC051319]|uniref:TadE family type IV pilus minor pilin n=1 Tax=Kutzneria sp. NPDC051319 TaxID=3155047 RepID=UPI00341BD1CD
MEAAIAICSLAVMLVLGLSAITAVVAAMRSVDTAAVVARLVARGDRARATEAARQLGPADADVSITVNGDEVSVTVTARSVPLLPGLRPSGTAYAVLEPGVSG